MTGPRARHTDLLLNDWLPSQTQRGKFLTTWGQGSELWDDHCLGYVKPTPRKDIAIFRVNWVQNLKEGIYRIAEEAKYHSQHPRIDAIPTWCPPREV